MQSWFHENLSRSLVKAVTFRSLILITDGIIIFAITHRTDVTAGVMLFSNIASTVMYLIHERIWDRVLWGKAKV